MNSKTFYQNVGILRASWYNENKQLTVFNYGTAFAISEQILVTCTHNIYFQKLNQYASEIIFIPNLSETTITPRTRVYKSAKGQYYRSLIPPSLNNKQPIKEELALIVLEQPIDVQHFHEIGGIRAKELQNEMKVIGYPSISYISSFSIHNIKVNRHQSSGRLFKTQKPNSHILSYTMKTSTGVSGSPILMRKQDGDFKIVGVHTHRGLTSQYSSGLYFNSQLLSSIKKWKTQLEEQFKLKKREVFDQQCWETCSNSSENQTAAQNDQDGDQQSQNSMMEDIQGYDQEEQFQTKSKFSIDYDIFEQDYNQLYEICQQTDNSIPYQKRTSSDEQTKMNDTTVFLRFTSNNL